MLRTAALLLYLAFICLIVASYGADELLRDEVRKLRPPRRSACLPQLRPISCNAQMSLAPANVLPLWAGKAPLCPREENATETLLLPGKQGSHYFVSPLRQAGAVIRGVNLTEPQPSHVIENLFQVLLRTGFLLFPEQNLTPKRQVEITKWFAPDVVGQNRGKTEYSYLSNDDNQGLTKIGDTGFHADYLWAPTPYMSINLHAINVSKDGDTLIASMARIISRYEQQWGLDDLLYLTNFRTDSSETCPFFAVHPFTGALALLSHLGGYPKGGNLRRDRVGAREALRTLSYEEQELLTTRINEIIYHDDVLYRHRWRKGDYLVIDNWGVMHRADPRTQLPVEEVGLRRIQRTCGRGYVTKAAQELFPVQG